MYAAHVRVFRWSRKYKPVENSYSNSTYCKVECMRQLSYCSKAIKRCGVYNKHRLWHCPALFFTGSLSVPLKMSAQCEICKNCARVSLTRVGRATTHKHFYNHANCVSIFADTAVRVGQHREPFDTTSTQYNVTHKLNSDEWRTYSLEIYVCGLWVFVRAKTSTKIVIS